MRQRYFIMKCMADFKQRNMTWTLLIDVDEYITFNRIQDDDPDMPLDVAPEGIPTILDWKPVYSFDESELIGFSYHLFFPCGRQMQPLGSLPIFIRPSPTCPCGGNNKWDPR